MEVILTNDLVIQCSNCREIHKIDKDSLEIKTFFDERQMGASVDYDYSGEIICTVCRDDIFYNIRAAEYPVGALEYYNYECRGGVFLQSPEVAVNYYEFDYDDIEEKCINSCINNINIEKVVRNRDTIYKLTSREFEELVAQVFENNGYNVMLTPETRDGGCDILATYEVNGLSFMIIIECKKYGKKNKVGISLVRSLLGVQKDQNANKGVLVTSSTFTRGAVSFAKKQNKLIDLIDIDELLRMMK